MDGEIYHHKQGRDPDYQRKETKSPLQKGSAVRAIKAQTMRNQIRKGVMPVAHQKERKL